MLTSDQCVQSDAKQPVLKFFPSFQRPWSGECFRGVGSQSGVTRLPRRQRSEAQARLPEGQLAQVAMCFLVASLEDPLFHPLC